MKIKATIMWLKKKKNTAIPHMELAEWLVRSKAPKLVSQVRHSARSSSMMHILYSSENPSCHCVAQKKFFFRQSGKWRWPTEMSTDLDYDLIDLILAILLDLDRISIKFFLSFGFGLGSIAIKCMKLAKMVKN